MRGGIARGMRGSEGEVLQGGVGGSEGKLLKGE